MIKSVAKCGELYNGFPQAAEKGTIKHIIFIIQKAGN